MYQTGGTIKETLQAIQQSKYVLPAIQREFVWKPEQIARLFDSLMQGYPFGTFLFWKVEGPNSGNYKFYAFVRNYHERDNPHCPQLPDFHDKELTAVLDGQQRLTALNIGLQRLDGLAAAVQVEDQPRCLPGTASPSRPPGGSARRRRWRGEVPVRVPDRGAGQRRFPRRVLVQGG